MCGSHNYPFTSEPILKLKNFIYKLRFHDGGGPNQQSWTIHLKEKVVKKFIKLRTETYLSLLIQSFFFHKFGCLIYFSNISCMRVWKQKQCIESKVRFQQEPKDND